MLKMNEVLKQLRIASNYSQEDLSTLIGCAKSTVSMYERGERSPDHEVLRKYAKIFKVDYNYLYGLTSDTALSVTTNSIKIPVIGQVAAGIPIEAITDILDYEEIPSHMVRDGSEFFALQLKGDSMEPRMKSGDVVIVRKQDTCDSGDIAIVCVNGDEATCKKVIKQANGILLMPFNSTYPPTFYDEEQIENLPVRIFGKVVELRAKF